MELPGITGAEALEDSPATTPTKRSDRVGLKIKLEGCEETLAKEKGEAIVNAEKCQLELLQEVKTTSGSISLRAAAAEKACTMAIEQPKTKCIVDLNATSINENQGLEGLKLKNKAALEVEVEAASEVKGLKATTSGCTGIPAKAEGSLLVKKALVLKGTELIAPATLDKPASKAIISFGEPNANELVEVGPVIEIGANEVLIESVTVVNLFPAGSTAFKLKAGSDTCVSPIEYNVGELCTYTLEFKPTKAKKSWLGEVRRKGKVAGVAFQDVDTLVGRTK